VEGDAGEQGLLGDVTRRVRAARAVEDQTGFIGLKA